ncbi:XRE family transcriptional regulator [Brevibacterium aurantiacum]|uniref:Transcriptional regulator, contains XRE-family HTH domain n=1 Tax=Brevibacterium aurantiacum TaxID=273384 RepID=A0A2H1J325_BREAU|nr:XRE family transcriptional regulator [Brevibacterium aurantiacum]SMX81875.1 Transcriptional regulator, contains XRE-family HTH domain [Brevibacterium aurantiacum]
MNSFLQVRLWCVLDVFVEGVVLVRVVDLLEFLFVDVADRLAVARGSAYFGRSSAGLLRWSVEYRISMCSIVLIMAPKTPRIQTFLDRVGSRVRELRKGQGWTIQRLADESSLSRRMLTQIELGQANPSLATIDRIAHALEVSFADLALEDSTTSAPGHSMHTPLSSSADLSSPEHSEPRNAHTLAWEGPHGSTAYILGASSVPGTELWRWHLGPHVRYQAEADRAGAEEILHILSGRLVLERGDESLALAAGMSTRVSTDQAYAYAAGEDATDFIRVVIGA